MTTSTSRRSRPHTGRLVEQPELVPKIPARNHSRSYSLRYLSTTGKSTFCKKNWQVSKKNRANFLRSVNHHLPIHRLPTEILHEIFLDACTSDASPVCSNDREELRYVSQTPLRIAAVCTHWREACLSSPHFWTFVFIDADDAHLSASVKSLAALYQERSSSTPFTCSISANYHRGYEDEVEEPENPTIPYIS